MAINKLILAVFVFSLVPAVLASEVYTIGGGIDGSQTIITYPYYLGDDSIYPEDGQSPDSDYSLRFFDDGIELKRFYIGLRDSPYDSSRIFSASVIVPVASDKIGFYEMETELAYLSFSDNAPVVSDLNIVQTGPRSFDMSWNATDDDDLLYRVYYSLDNGLWVPSGDSEEQQFSFGDDLIPYGDIRLKVEATDGLHVGEAISPTYSFGSSNQVFVYISEPDQGDVYSIGMPILLQGGAYDNILGFLYGNNLEWSSDIDGILGTGSMVNAGALSLGTHSITLTAYGQSTETESIDIIITDETNPDVFIKNISLNPEQPDVGETVEISAVVSSLNAGALFTANFLLGGAGISSANNSVGVNEEVIVKAYWNATEGQNVVNVVIEDVVPGDADITNNEISKWLSIGRCHDSDGNDSKLRGYINSTGDGVQYDYCDGNTLYEWTCDAANSINATLNSVSCEDCTLGRCHNDWCSHADLNYDNKVTIIDLGTMSGKWYYLDCKGAIAYYPFDHDASDSTKNNNHGTEYGEINYTPGKIRGAAEFDTDYIELTPIIPTTIGSITYWFKTNQTSQQIIVYASDGIDAKYNGFGDLNDIFEMHTAVRNGGRAGFFYQDGNETLALNSSTIVADGKWHFIAVTYNMSDNISLYIDGNLESELDITQDFNGIIPKYNFIGKPGANTRFFNGGLDDIRIYDYVLHDELLALNRTFEPDWCIGGDMNRDGRVNIIDLSILSGNWKRYDCIG